MAAPYKSAVLLVLIRENRNRLDMEGLREHIDRRCLQKLKAGRFEQLHVARPRSWVAAHIRHAQGRRLGDGATDVAGGLEQGQRGGQQRAAGAAAEKPAPGAAAGADAPAGGDAPSPL